MFPFLAQIFLFALVLYYAVYVFLELRMVRCSRRRHRACLAGMSCSATCPPLRDTPYVSVLLPICNERLVVKQLLAAVCALAYPPDKLEILVLDDSTDDTTDLARATVSAQAAQGVNIKFLRRETRDGYKAGNLNFGMRHAKGDFLVIFDADCIPPSDFLLKSIPCFHDERVGFLQTAIKYVNREASFLTRFQALEAGHQQFVTGGLYHNDLMASLTGNSCVWRRSCVESIGGISAATITEDVDLSYRAQLSHWKYVFLSKVIAVTELPETMSAFRVQRERWARGLVHNALRHVQSMLATAMSLTQRMHAVSLMFSSLLLASFFLLLLLSLPMALMSEHLGFFFNLSCTLFLALAMLWACANACSGRQSPAGAKEKETALWVICLRTYAYTAFFFPMSLYYFCAAVQVFLGIQGGFNRTPKGGAGARSQSLPINTVLFWLEVLSFAYASAALMCGLWFDNYWVVLLNCIACSGFAMALFFSWEERSTYVRT